MLGDIMKYVKDVKIYSENNEGSGICKVNNIVTFVPFSLKGELVDINITKENKKFNIGETTIRKTLSFLPSPAY